MKTARTPKPKKSAAKRPAQRRASKSRAATKDRTPGAREIRDEATGLVFATRDRAQSAARDVDRASERAAAGASRARSLSEATSEKLVHYAGRAESAAVSARRIGELFERLSLVALNAGLEGARQSDHAGRALLLVSEEMRIHTARGTELSRELSATADEFVAAATDVAQHVERLLRETADLASEVTRARAASQEIGRALAELGGGLGQAAGFDAALEKHVALAVEHARNLSTAISAIENETAGVDSKAAALRAISPALRRLVDRIPARPSR